MAVTLSANVDDQMAMKVRNVAEREHRSISNVVSSALTVFTGLPKEVRDTILELQSQGDAVAFKRFARDMMATMARARLETLTSEMAAEGLFGNASRETDETALMEEATRLTLDARDAKRRS